MPGAGSSSGAGSGGRHRSGRYRYGSWAGGADPLAPPFDVRAAVDEIGRDVMEGSSLREAMERLMRRGLGDRSGLDELRRELARRRREVERRGNLAGTLDQVREELDRALSAEREFLAGRDGDDARLAEMALDTLPDDTAGQVRELNDYQWRSAEGQQHWQNVLDLLRRDVLDAQFAGMKEALSGQNPVAMEAVREMMADLNALLAKHARGEDTTEDFDRFKDSLHPDRLVYGVSDGAADHPAVAVLDEVYASIVDDGTRRIVTDLATAELVKVAANSFLATKISFINAMAELCEVTGADVTHLADAIGVDERIGRKFLNAGLGFGGGCLPKDIRAFMAQAERLHAEPAVTFLREIDSINQRRRERMVDLTLEVLAGRPIAGARIAVLGAAFKPDSDDIRDSPALDVADRLAGRRATVVVTDPQALPNARRRSPHLIYVDTPEEAVEGADAVLLLTEWEEYRRLDPEKLGHLLRHRRIVDGRNVLDPVAWREAGWVYRALGRP